MIVCPRCSQENEDSAMNCVNCRINLQWVLENLPEGVRPSLERVEMPPPEAQARARAFRGFLVIALLFAIPALGFLAFLSWLYWALSRGGKSDYSGYLVAAGFLLVVAVVCIPAAIVVLLRRQPRANLLPAVRILALIAVTGALLFGLMRLTLVILPEHTGQSLITQYKLGERDFRGATLEGADLREADLHEANLRGAHLSGADLREAKLYRTDLSGTELSGADLAGANLYEANLSGADLREADLTGAYLLEADLTGADLRRTDLRTVDLAGAYLTGAAVTNEQLDQAWSLVGTILPDGSVHE
jgi:hypothetical protein